MPNRHPSLRRRAFALGLIGAPFAASARDNRGVKFLPLSPAELAGLARQRAFVSSLVARSFPGEKITRSQQDLQLLQRILDGKLVAPTSTWELQALGVVFGDALVADRPGLAWWQVTDEFGTDPTLRYQNSSLQINALTMLSKRVERGEAVDVEQMAEWVSEFIRTRSHEFP